LCYFAQKYVKNFEAAKEIVQDAFLGLWEKRETIDLNRPVKSYLTTSIFNRCQNYLRDNQKFSSDLLGIENLLEQPDMLTPDFLVEAELETAIKAAIDQLPEKCREIFLLNRFENLKYQEIADKLGISQKTVEAQMSKALQHMRVKLSEYLFIGLMIGILEKIFLGGT
jgi:RNA polymerase sigma-70 factor, ECF subfamily